MVRELFKQGLGALLVVVLLLAVVRPLFKNLMSAPPRTTELVALPTGGVIEPPSDRLTLGGEATLATAAMDYEQRVALAKRMVGQDAKQVAQVVKSWVAEDGS